MRQSLNRYPQLAEFFKPKAESFRVVDVNRAGSLERDTVIFSLGVGRARLGQSSHNLGLLSGAYGREGFVVGLTRARRATHLVSCVSPADMNAQKLHEGALDLYRLMLAYEEHQQQVAAQTPRADVLAANAWLDTEDEPTDPPTEDWLLNDAAARLRERGVRVRPGEGEIAFIAFAPQQPDNAGQEQESTQRMPLMVGSDVLVDYAAESVREHTRLVPERLSRTGWNYVTLNTLEVFADPEGVVARILRYVGAPAD